MVGIIPGRKKPRFPNQINIYFHAFPIIKSNLICFICFVRLPFVRPCSDKRKQTQKTPRNNIWQWLHPRTAGTRYGSNHVLTTPQKSNNQPDLLPKTEDTPYYLLFKYRIISSNISVILGLLFKYVLFLTGLVIQGQPWIKRSPSSTTQRQIIGRSHEAPVVEITRGHLLWQSRVYCHLRPLWSIFTWRTHVLTINQLCSLAFIASRWVQLWHRLCYALFVKAI